MEFKKGFSGDSRGCTRKMAKSFEPNQVLIVEDQEDMREMIVTMLKDAGIKQVCAVGDGEQAMRCIKRSLKRIDLVICDWNIPQVTGIKILKALRELSKDTPFLMVTGRKDIVSVFEAQKFGVDGYLSKPFSPIDFEQKVKRLLAKSKTAA